MKLSLAPLYAVVAATTALAASIKRQDDGKFSLADNDGETFTFKYSTSWADDKNWIGIYGLDKGPVDDKKGPENSLVWDWTPGDEGEVKLPATPLLSGTYEVYFLWQGGYESLAEPIKVEHSAPRKKDFTVMTNNLWHQGTKVNGYKEKQVRFFKDSGADIIALQESSEERTSELATSLNWNSWHSDDHGILSRYPIRKRYGEHEHGVAISVALDDQTDVKVWDVHLAYDPYGPYEFCFNKKSKEEVIKEVEGGAGSGRGPEIIQTLDMMKGDLGDADNVPVLLMGDFNAPSHLDWTDETAHLHCDVGAVEWPTSKAPIDAGLVDSLREVHPDPNEFPAFTWSPVYKDNEGRPEPQDRIDFVYHKGKKLTVESAELVMVGEPKEMPDHKDNEWTSDHQAVRIKYNIG